MLGAGSAVQIMSGAFVMGLMSLVFVLLLVHSARLEQAGSYILAGIIVSSLADAGLMVLKIMADPEKELAAIEFWTMGSLAGITADKLFSNVLFIVIPVSYTHLHGPNSYGRQQWGILHNGGNPDAALSLIHI